MVLLDPDAFLTQFTRILEKSRAKGTIYVTLKRYAGKEGKNVDAVDPADCRCLVRAARDPAPAPAPNALVPVSKKRADATNRVFFVACLIAASCVSTAESTESRPVEREV